MILIKISGPKLRGLMESYQSSVKIGKMFQAGPGPGVAGGWWLCKVCCCCSLDPVSTHLAAYLKGHTLHPFDSTVKNQEKIAF